MGKDKKLIKNIILSQKNFHLLPRDSSDRCTYRGDLSISGKDVKKLPDNLTIDGNLYCSNNGMEELPIGLVVNGEMNCYKNKLKKLPNDLTIKKDLFCFDNLLEDVPKSIIIGGNIFCYANNMNIFRIIENNTKRIIYDKYKPKNTLPVTIDLSEDEKLEKEAKEKLEKEAKESEEKRLEEEEKMDNMSEFQREIYIRVTAIKKKRKDMTVSRYSHYYGY